MNKMIVKKFLVAMTIPFWMSLNGTANANNRDSEGGGHRSDAPELTRTYSGQILANKDDDDSEGGGHIVATTDSEGGGHRSESSDVVRSTKGRSSVADSEGGGHRSDSSDVLRPGEGGGHASVATVDSEGGGHRSEPSDVVRSKKSRSSVADSEGGGHRSEPSDIVRSSKASSSIAKADSEGGGHRSDSSDLTRPPTEGGGHVVAVKDDNGDSEGGGHLTAPKNIENKLLLNMGSVAKGSVWRVNNTMVIKGVVANYSAAQKVSLLVNGRTNIDVKVDPITREFVATLPLSEKDFKQMALDVVIASQVQNFLLNQGNLKGFKFI